MLGFHSTDINCIKPTVSKIKYTFYISQTTSPSIATVISKTNELVISTCIAYNVQQMAVFTRITEDLNPQ